MEFIVLLLIIATVTALAAQARGRSPLAWFLLGLVFSVFALIAVLVMQRIEATPQPDLLSNMRSGSGRVGRTVLHHKGFDITEEETGYKAANRLFSSIPAAQVWIDSLSPPKNAP